MQTDAHDAIIQWYLSGAISAPSAVAQLLIDTGDVNAAATAVMRARAQLDGSAHDGAGARERLARLEAFLSGIDAGCVRVVQMLRDGMDASLPAASPDAAIEACRRAFDQFVLENEEASVALYSLGDPALLAQATREIVDLLQAWGALGPDRALLDIGCGIGRLEPFVAPTVREVYGIDVSPNMVATARRRCAGIPNARFELCTGRDLGSFADASFDTVCAVDSFPYLYASGMPLVESHFAEVRRVLRPGGTFAIFNLSYRGTPAADRDDAARLASGFGFELLVNGTRPFTLWDGLAFHLQRRG